MKPLPKVIGYFALLASLAATYFAQTGTAPPGWLNNVLVVLAMFSHSTTGTAPLNPLAK